MRLARPASGNFRAFQEWGKPRSAGQAWDRAEHRLTRSSESRRAGIWSFLAAKKRVESEGPRRTLKGSYEVSRSI